MILRYTRPEMAAVWTDENRFEKMLLVEITACEAMVKQGKVPAADLKTIKARAKINPQRINELEKVIKHDVISFLTQVEQTVGKAARHLHMGMTSSDVLDSALALQMVEAAALLRDDLSVLLLTVRDLARKHRDTLMAGRTHGVHAEPTTFGLKVAGWYSELKRGADRLKQAQEIAAFGKISGAVGTYAHVDPFVEKYVCKKLGLQPEPVSTQIVPRDRHAQYLSLLALVAATLERVALEIRHLQRTEVLEAEEPFTEGQKGSSAMPHKRNPIACENVCGLSRLVRSYAGAALENVALWHERDISHSSVERVILPDATIALDFMIHRMNGVLSGLAVYPERMKENLGKTFQVLASQRLMLELLKRAGRKFSRQDAYKVIQTLAQRAWTQGEDFKALVRGNPEITAHLDPRTIESCFDPKYFVRHADKVFKSAGL